MTVSDIIRETKLGRAAMYTILVDMPTELDAQQVASELEDKVNPGGRRTELFVWHLPDRPTTVDAYTFDLQTAQSAHQYLSARAA